MAPSIPQTLTPLQFDVALRTLATRAHSRYAGEGARIDRGLVLALNGHVTLLPDGTALVRSERDPEVQYHVAAGMCDCPDGARAPEHRCKHNFACALVKKATLCTHQQPVTPRFFATYYPPSGAWIPGIATATNRGWLFIGDEGEEPQYVDSKALSLGGNVALAEAQRTHDGDLVRKICGY